MIYFLSRPSDGLIKIGRSCRLARRLRELTAANESGLVVLAIADESRHREPALHWIFRSLRVTGEWFRPAPVLLAWIAKNGRAWDATADDVTFETVRLPSDLLAMARVVAEIEHVTVLDLLTEILEPALTARERAAVARRIAAVGLED